MSATDRTEADYSKGNRGFRTAPEPSDRPTLALLALAAGASIVLIVSDFLTLYEIRVVTVVRRTVSGHEHHGYAIALIGAAALGLSLIAALSHDRERTRTAALLGLAALGLAALLIVAASDISRVHSTAPIGEFYDGATASPKLGFFVETLGAVLLLFSGGCLTALAAGGLRRARAKARRGRAATAQGTQAATGAPVDAEEVGWL